VTEYIKCHTLASTSRSQWAVFQTDTSRFIFTGTYCTGVEPVRPLLPRSIPVVTGPSAPEALSFERFAP